MTKRITLRRKGSPRQRAVPPHSPSARLHETGVQPSGSKNPAGSFKAALRAFRESGRRARRFASVDALLARGTF
jgi:hypothetical protein